MTKDDVQREAIELIKEHNRLVLQWCTGLGKSKAALDILKQLFLDHLMDESKQGQPFRILLVVAETAHKNNWKEEFIKWKVEDYIWEQMVSIDTYASLKNHRNEHYDYVILDEGHHAGSELRLDILEDITADNVLILSATLPAVTLNRFESIFGKFVVSKITLQTAISWGILPEPKIYLIPMQLDNTRLIHTVVEEWGVKFKRKLIQADMTTRWTYLKNKVFYPNARMEIKCTAQQKYNYLTEKGEYWKRLYVRNRNAGVKNKWLQFGSERKRFLGELKTGNAAYLLDKLNKAGKRYICFCSSISQAEKLGGTNSIHSQKKGALDTINKFNNKEINSLYAIGMIQEGQNLTDIESGVIIQLDGQERAFVQKSGRAMRASEPSLYILYFKNTRDEEYLEKALEGIDPSYVTVIDNLSDL